MLRVMIPIFLLISTSIAIEPVSLDEVSDLILTWDCQNYAQGKSYSYQELFAKSGSRVRIERWFALPGVRLEPDSRYVYIGYGSGGALYSPCCKSKTVDADEYDSGHVVREIAYGVPWWIDMNKARIVDDFKTGALVYSWPYKKVYLSRASKLPTEVRYFNTQIKYSNYINIPGLGSIPKKMTVYEQGRVVLEKEMTISNDRPAEILFNARNLPFKEGNKRVDSEVN